MLGKPLVSVVIGSYNRYGFLKGVVNSVRNELNNLAFEIIVVDGGSTDGSIEWLNQQKDIITILQHNRGVWQNKPIIRRSWGYFTNLAFKAAQGRYLLMLSDDCLLVPNAVQNGIKLFESFQNSARKIGGVAFYWREWPDKKDYWVTLVFDNRMMINHGLFLRSAAEEVGWIEEDLYDFYHADTDFALKLWNHGYEIIDSPDSFVEHYEHLGNNIRQENVQRASEDWQTLLNRWTNIFYQPSTTPLHPFFQYKGFEDPHKTAESFNTLAEDKPTIAPVVQAMQTGNTVLTPIPLVDQNSLSRTTQISNTFRIWNELRLRQDMTSQRSAVLSRIAPLGAAYRLLARVKKLGAVWAAQANFYVDVVHEIEAFKQHLITYTEHFNQSLAALQNTHTTIQALQELSKNDATIQQQALQELSKNSAAIQQQQSMLLKLNENLNKAHERIANLEAQQHERIASFEAQQAAQLSQIERLQNQARINTSYIRFLIQNRAAPSPKQPSEYEQLLVPALAELESEYPELKNAQSADFSVQDGQASSIVNTLAAYLGSRLQVMLPEVWYHFDYQTTREIDAQVYHNAVSKVQDNGWFVLICRDEALISETPPRLKLHRQLSLKSSNMLFKAYWWRKLPEQRDI